MAWIVAPRAGQVDSAAHVIGRRSCLRAQPGEGASIIEPLLPPNDPRDGANPGTAILDGDMLERSGVRPTAADACRGGYPRLTEQRDGLVDAFGTDARHSATPSIPSGSLEHGAGGPDRRDGA